MLDLSLKIFCDNETNDNQESSPFIYALKEGRLDIDKYLISACADREGKDEEDYGKTPLIYASSQIIKTLFNI